MVEDGVGYWWVVVANILIVVKVTVGTTINPTDWQSFSAIKGCQYLRCRLRRCRCLRWGWVLVGDREGGTNSLFLQRVGCRDRTTELVSVVFIWLMKLKSMR